MQLAKQQDQLSPIHHRKEWRWFTMPHPIMMYGLMFWGNFSHSAKKNCKMQRTCFKWLYDAEVETHVDIYLRI